MKHLTDRRPIVIVLEGGDCVGKTSTLDMLQQGFPGRVVRALHFDRKLAPYLGKEPVHHGALKRLAAALDGSEDASGGGKRAGATRWLRGAERQLPGAGEVAILDRSRLYSGIVYEYLVGKLTPEQARERARAVNDLEKTLGSKAHLVKLYFHASAEKTLDKFAERELFHPEKLDGVDYQMLTEHKKIDEIFRIVRQGTSTVPWHEIDMDHRGEGRVAAIDAIIDGLK